jgi:hypothetical protein
VPAADGVRATTRRRQPAKVTAQALDRWLSTVIKVEDAEVGAVEETLTVRLRYVILARQERRYLNLEVAL